MHNLQNQDVQQELEELKVPEFEPNIPEYLLQGRSKPEIWMAEQISIQGQQNSWLIRRAQKQDLRTRETIRELASLDGRVALLEAVKQNLTAKWSLLAGLLLVVVVPVAVSVCSSWVMQHLGIRKP